MNTQKRVFNKLAEEDKVELATQKVELSTEGISKLLNEVKSFINDIDGSEKKARKLVSSIKNNISETSILKKVYISNKKEIDSKGKLLTKYFNTIYKQSKDLGVDLKTVPAYKDYLSVQKMLNDSSDKNQDFWTSIAKYI